MTTILRKIQAHVPDCTYRVDTGLRRLKDTLEHYDINLNPEYQRDHVWTEEQESKFVGALLENHDAIPPFWFNWTNKRLSAEVVDGKQRLKACLRWLGNEFAAVCPCGEEVWHKELCEIDLRGISTTVTMSWKFVELDEIEVMKFYLRLNSGGTIHSQHELDRVRNLITKRSA